MIRVATIDKEVLWNSVIHGGGAIYPSAPENMKANGFRSAAKRHQIDLAGIECVER